MQEGPNNPDQEEWWFPVSGGIIDHPGLSPSAKFLWIVFQRYRDVDTNKCFPSFSLLCERTGMGERKVRRYLKELVNAGIVVHEERRVENHFRGYLFTVKSTKDSQVIGNELGCNNAVQKRRPVTPSSNDPLTRSTTRAITRSKNYPECPPSADKQTEMLRLHEQAKTLAEHYGLPESIAENAADEIAANPKVGYPEKALPEVIRKISEDRKQSSQPDW